MCAHTDTIIELCELCIFKIILSFLTVRRAEHNHNFFTVLLKDRLEKIDNLLLFIIRNMNAFCDEKIFYFFTKS